ncbi:MAG: hypothetical protein KQJ78_21605 [Deltaproteobacteria bacterium]|nr:hypothetical protein [Deltaproteobacteria bacterium]
MLARWSLWVVCFLLAAGPALAETPPVYDQNWEKVGKQIYFDTSLSDPAGQSCASCHDPAWGWASPDPVVNAAGAVVPGVVSTLAGNRKPPSAAYAGASPVQYVDADGLVVGGVFWDGRANGAILGDPLAEQAIGPPVNRVEMHNPNVETVVWKVIFSSYGADFLKLYQRYWGESAVPNGFSLEAARASGGTFTLASDVASKAYKVIGYAVAAFERSAEVNPFDSRFDQFWDAAGAAGLDVTLITTANFQNYQGLGLTNDEVRGLAIFNDATKGNCAACHVLDAGVEGYPLFTDFTYDNLGVPKNLANPFYTMPADINPLSVDWLDLGVGGILGDATLWGKQKVPTLRNVDKRPTGGVKDFTHNGFFKTLEEVVHFYNTRDVEVWPAAEVPTTVNDTELGNLGLNNEEEALLVLFMKTLSDTSTVSPAINVGMRRLYDPSSGRHLFTISPGEATALIAMGWQDESSPQPFFVSVSELTGSKPVYRLYNPYTGAHYLTLRAGERTALISQGWQADNNQGFMFPTAQAGTSEVYTLYNAGLGDHLYTANPNELAWILTNLPTWEQQNSLGFTFRTLPN